MNRTSTFELLKNPEYIKRLDAWDKVKFDPVSGPFDEHNRDFWNAYQDLFLFLLGYHYWHQAMDLIWTIQESLGTQQKTFVIQEMNRIAAEMSDESDRRRGITYGDDDERPCPVY